MVRADGVRYGAQLVLKDVLKGAIDVRLRIKFLFFSRTWRKNIVTFNGFSLPPITIFQGDQDVSTADWGTIKLPMPFFGLRPFEPGEIILTQGAPGHSLFILSTGMVRVYVKDENGVYRFVRDMEEGSFFGEFAILTGQPRAATVTAATRCELLELDRGTLDAISIAHPHIQQVLRQFYEERMKTQG